MKRVEFELDDVTSALVEAMAKSEGVQVEQISREALAEYLKKFYKQVYNHLGG